MASLQMTRLVMFLEESRATDMSNDVFLNDDAPYAVIWEFELDFAAQYLFP